MEFSVRNLLPVATLLGLALMAGCGDPAAMNESTANMKRITQADFTNVVSATSGTVAVDFYATWCGPCKQQAPILDKQADLFKGQIKFFKVNVDESPALAQELQVKSIPTVLLFQNGKVTDRIIGPQTEKYWQLRLEAFTRGK
jgi:thioredoxin 1